MERAELINRLEVLSGVEVEVIGTWIWVSGDTKPYKEELKELGGRWSGKRKMWYFTPENSKARKGSSKMDMDGLRQKYGNAS